MAGFVNDAVLDAALRELAAASAVVALAGEPASYAAADAGRLVSVPLNAGDFSFGDGLVSGRRISVAAKAGVTALASGTADHVALLDEAGGRVLFVATCPAAAVAAGGSVDLAGWDIELGDPV